jgi:hypothetical protein
MRDYVLYFDCGCGVMVADLSTADINDCLRDGVHVQPGDNCESEENFLERCRIELVARTMEGRL